MVKNCIRDVEESCSGRLGKLWRTQRKALVDGGKDIGDGVEGCDGRWGKLWEIERKAVVDSEESYGR